MKCLIFLLLIVPSFAIVYESECFWCLLVGGTLHRITLPLQEDPAFQCVRNTSHYHQLLAVQNASLWRVRECTWANIWATSSPAMTAQTPTLADVLKAVNSTVNQTQDQAETIAILVQLFIVLMTQLFVMFQLSKISKCKEQPRHPFRKPGPVVYITDIPEEDRVKERPYDMTGLLGRDETDKV
jgi:hypothetical protein